MSDARDPESKPADDTSDDGISTVASFIRGNIPFQIGPYRILSLISEGGMGVVYKAEQRKPLQRTVAIKVIKLGIDTNEVIARFESERQALARMDHPNIAKVLDAGTSDAGRPYFVMEYVPGKPITEFADDNKLSVKQRLELFTEVCDAIAHAHTKAVIHRDIKAANVLVYLQDRKPTVKVIDFGIAKALTTDRLTERTFATEIGHIIGTYDTMSPEQAEGSPDIDTRTDVYSLGVLLYELLTGFRPFDGATLRAAAQDEIKRIIREVDPPRPSTRLSHAKSPQEVTRIATDRQTHSDTLARTLRSELEWIPLKAIRKERDRRYESVLQLGQDVKNYLANRPLIAAPESALYRVRKFTSRHRGPAIGATIAIAAAIALPAVYIHGIKTEEAKTVAALRQAEDERLTTATVSDFLQKMLTGAGPAVSQGRDSSLLKGLLDDAARNTDSLSDRPLVRASILLTLGETYGDIGSVEQSREIVERAHDIFLSQVGPDDRRTLIAALDLVGPARIRSNLDDAESRVRDVLARATRKFGPDDRLTLTATEELALTLQQATKSEEAMKLFREAYENRRRISGDDDPDTLETEHNLAYALAEQGDPRQAEPLARDALARRARVRGELHPDTLATLHMLASAQLGLGRLDDARKSFADFYERCRKVYGEENLYTSMALSEMAGRMSFYAGAYPDATQKMQAAIQVRRNLHAEDELHSLQMIRDLGQLELRQGHIDAAQKLAAESLQRSEQKLGPQNPDTLDAMCVVAKIDAQIGGAENLAKAVDLARRAVDGTRKALGPTHARTAGYLNLLGDILQVSGKTDDAIATYKELFTIAPKSQSRPADICMYMSSYGLALAKAGRGSEAIAPLTEAEARCAADAPGSRSHRAVLSELVKINESAGRADDAKRYREKLDVLGGSPATKP